MTIFDDTSLLSVATAQENHLYSQVLAKAKLKALHAANRLDSTTWKELQILIPDRKWIHALKLGLLTEDEYHDGGRDNDNEAEPHHVIYNPSLEEITDEIIDNQDDINKDNALDLEIISTNDDVETDVIEEAVEIQNEEVADEVMDIQSENVTDGEGAEAEPEKLVDAQLEDTEDGTSEESDLDPEIITEPDSPLSILNDESNHGLEIVEEEEVEETSPFVTWLNSLPATDIKPSENSNKKKRDKKSKKKKSKKKLKKKDKKKDKKKKDKKKKSDKDKKKKKGEKKEKKKDKKDKKKKSTKKSDKKVKKKKPSKKQNSKKGKKKDKDKKNRATSKAAALPFQARIVNSLLLNDTISSETLAQLLKEHGHDRLAKKMYKRLAVKYPNKRSYFKKQIQSLTEEEE